MGSADRWGTVAAGADAIAGVRPAEIEAVLPMPSADVMLALLGQMEGYAEARYPCPIRFQASSPAIL